MVSTPEVFTNNSNRSPMTPKPVKKPSASKSLCIFSKILDAKNKTTTHQVGAAKSERKEFKEATKLWATKKAKSKFKNQQ